MQAIFILRTGVFQFTMTDGYFCTANIRANIHANPWKNAGAFGEENACRITLMDYRSRRRQKLSEVQCQRHD
jgi:hypothetical protein